MNLRPTLCLAIYRRLANAYPHEFRMLYGEELDRMGEDAIPEVWRRYGLSGVLNLLADVAVQLPATYAVEIRKDVAYALRMLTKSPGFTSVAVLSLAIGIGMCCTVLSEVSAVVGPPAGVHDPAALVTIRNTVSYPYFERYRDQHQTTLGATAFLASIPFAVALTAEKGANAGRFNGHLVSPEYFSTLGVPAASGRFFDPESEKPDMPPVVVVSDRFWRTILAEDSHAVGRKLRLNGRMVTVVGIGPKDFLGIWPANPADLFVPVTCGASLAPELSGDPLNNRDREIFRVVLRLRPGMSTRMAEAALDAATRNLDRENGVPERDRDGKLVRLMPAGTIMFITPENRAFMDTFNRVLWALVLSLLCTNLANLLLARGAHRKREIAVRLSVGASRPRLIRQFLTESMVLSFVGGLVGIALAYGITRAISSLLTPPLTTLEFNCKPNFHVVVLTLVFALLAGASFGLAPALSAARIDFGHSLKEGAQAPVRGYRRFGLRNLFVVCQMTASLMLLLVTWYVATGFLHSARRDPGFAASDLSLISLDPVRDGYSANDSAALLMDLPDELSRPNGVRGVSLMPSVPFATLIAEQANTRVSSSVGYGDGVPELSNVLLERVGANYFATLGVPLLAGREFARQDQSHGSPEIPAVNQTAARQLFGLEDPIGRRIREGRLIYMVVGLTPDVQSGFLMPRTVATVFLPITADWLEKNPAERPTILVHCTPGFNTVAVVRSTVSSLHPDLTVFNARTVAEDLHRLNSFVEWDATIYMVLALFALLLATLGLGGVTAYAVARRRKEIGIRMALGARSYQVQGLVLSEGAVLILVGTVLGCSGAFAASRIFSASSAVLARTFANRVDIPFLAIGGTLILVTLAMLACYLPARRATKIDPVVTLHCE